METYKNSYTKENDELLWELHEIRHVLHEEWKNKTIDERNKYIMELYKKQKREWKKNLSFTPHH